MRIAVTNHAVDRFLERAEGVAGFNKDSVRAMIRQIVEDGFELGEVRDHPYEADRRIIPFKSGKSILYLSIGKNTTTFPADLAVIGVLFEKEATEGKVGLGATIGDTHPDLKNIDTPQRRHPMFRVFIGSEDTIESYRLDDEDEVEKLLLKRQADPSAVAVYRLVEG